MTQQADQIYQSFLVRCWLVSPATADGPPIWRFELREVLAEQREHRFSDLEQLKNFVAAELAALAASNAQGTDTKDGQKGASHGRVNNNDDGNCKNGK